MTRFARAKGSKASNEKTPEDSTPWEVMKGQLLNAKKDNEDAKKRNEAEQQRIENYENFLKEHKTQKRKATWCDFPETEHTKNVVQKVSAESAVPKKKKKKEKKSSDGEVQNKNGNGVEQPAQKKVIYNQKSAAVNSEQVKSDEIKANKKGKKKKKKGQNTQNNNVTESAASESTFAEGEPTTTPNSEGKKKQKRNKKNKQAAEASDNHTEDVSNNNTAEPANKEQLKNNQRQKPKKNKNLANDQVVRRKPVDDRSFRLIINGKDVELVRYDGFPIMKRDAERLDELKKNMNKKGIPKSEVQRTMKLERRRAEKALARLKRDVCYNCRKGGHNLSDCPDLKTKIPGVEAGDGMCFKCGSLEHRQFECKVQKDKEFRFATCFICKEPGHIARQCPDNPKGLYPNGGGCKLCGDVTHLRKDCPTVNEKKESTSIKLPTLDSTDTLEGIEPTTKTYLEEQQKKPKKIKF